MGNLDKEVRGVLKQIMELIVPPGMTPKERKALATKAGISQETLRKNLQRKSLNADTLVRLLLARGVSAETLKSLPQEDLSKLPAGEATWIELGRRLSEPERTGFADMVQYLRARWPFK